MTSAQTRSRSRPIKKDDVSEAPVTPVGYLMTDSGQKWREPVIRRLNELTALQSGWDGYEGVPVSFQNAYFAMEMLDACCRGDAPPPQIVPGSNGDLQIEWHLERGDIELHILGPNDVRAWHANENTGFDGEEVPLTNDFTMVLRWIRNLTEPTRATVSAASR
jgi:hypothetical protein